MNVLKGKKIVLGITGSIAAYKSCHIIRGLIKRGAEVQVVITPAGKEFITPITLSALTHKPVINLHCRLVGGNLVKVKISGNCPDLDNFIDGWIQTSHL